MNSQSRVFIGSCGPFSWEDGKVENEKEVEKWEDRKDFNFPHLFLVEMVEKWRNGKKILIDWEEKNDNRKCDLYKFIQEKKWE